MRELTTKEVESVSGAGCTASVNCSADAHGEVSCEVTVTCYW